MVLFVTGRCTRSCWYCPISSERRDRDIAYANDRKITEINDIIDEANLMSALGTGVTGGEPLLVLDRVVDYCSLLKQEFGNEHHIHLYTGLAPKMADLERLEGLVDEIRLHPPHEQWNGVMNTPFIKSATLARRLGFSVGIEVPSLPGIGALAVTLPFIDFMNINELEWSETNARAMRERGYDLEDSYHNAVGGAYRLARGMVRKRKVHWCSSAFKDSVQLKERLKRIAGNSARSFEEITDDGTVIYGVVEPAPKQPTGIENAEIVNGCLELHWQVLHQHQDRLPGKKYIVERYPNGGMVVEMTPL
jgi:pyruvate formate-lyase activating enzyme-like uncharacterized protein